MRSREGAECRCNGSDFVPDHVRRTSRASEEGCRPRKFLRGQADKSSWTMVPCPLWVKSGHVRCNRPCPLYSRKRTYAVQELMSAKGQKRTSACLFDHLVRDRKDTGRNGQAERLRGLEVNYQLKFCRL